MSDLEAIKVVKHGQIKKGDVLVLEKSNGVKTVVPVKDVINENTELEEILLAKKRNIYFIMSMMLNGESWVKTAWILKDTRVTELINNMNIWN